MPRILVIDTESIEATNSRDYRERRAAIKAGFTVLHVGFHQLFISDQSSIGTLLRGNLVFLRHFAHHEGAFKKWISENQGSLMVPNYDMANKWYEVVLSAKDPEYWLGRKMAYENVESMFSEDLSFEEATKKRRNLIESIFAKYSIDNKVFLKTPSKYNLDAGLYTKEDIKCAFDQLAVFSHMPLTTLIYSQPVEVKKINHYYRREEYRCLIIDNKISSVSLYSDRRTRRDYLEVREFAEKFVECFKRHLPHSYCLDVMRLIDGRVVVVELNDIAAMGFYADNDIEKFYADAYRINEG